MPQGTRVHRVYTALRDDGKTKASAARIAQAQTGQALMTGKAPKRVRVRRKEPKRVTVRRKR